MRQAPGLARASTLHEHARWLRAGGRQIEEGRFAELSNALVLPPVDDLRQAALYLPYALLPSDAALAAEARRAQPHPLLGCRTCMHSRCSPPEAHACLAAGPADLPHLSPTVAWY